MDKTAPRRSLRIRKLKIANDRKEYGEPESKKRSTGTPRKSLDGEESSVRDCESPETGGSLISPEPCTIQQLPQEILQHIFGFLEIEDRKSVRLVCRLWYQCSTCSPITKKEKFVFQTESSIEDITKVMLKSHFSILNLDFRCLQVNRLPIDFWKECGNQIHSLIFYGCELDVEFVENVIVHCINLRSLTFKQHNYWSPSRWPLLNLIVEKGIQRPKLHTLSLFIDDPSTEIIIVKTIFHVCPCIRHFTTREISPNLISYLPISLKSLTFTQVPFFTHKNKDQKCITSTMEAWIAKAKHGLRLERFSGKFAGMEISSTKETLLNFFSLQKNLNAIKIELHMWDLCSSEDADISRVRTHMKEIFFHILKTCPSLQQICVESNYCFLTFEWKECPQFLSSISKLQSLHLDLCVRSDGQNSSSESHLPFVLTLSKNLVLTTLELRFSRVNYSKEEDQLCAALFQHCPLLRHLKLCNSSHSTLSMIFKYLLKLQTLILWYDKKYNFGNNYGFTSHDDSTAEGYSIKQLQQLKSFSISSPNWNSLKPLTERIMVEIQLPHLEFLELNTDFILSLEEESMNHLSSQIPKLKCLSLVCGTIISSSRDEECCKILQFFIYLKNVHSVHIYMLFPFDSSIIDRIFRVCPSIKYVTTRGFEFFFDPITRKIKCNRHYDNFIRFRSKVYDIFHCEPLYSTYT